MASKQQNTVMIVDGGHLRALLGYPNVPRMTAANIERILHNCVTDDEYLQRIYYYDCSNFIGQFHTLYPGWGGTGKECISLYGNELRKRIKRGSQFHILNQPAKGPELPSVDNVNTAVWIAGERTARILRELALKDLFVVRHGKMSFKYWKKNTKMKGAAYFPEVQQKGVDMLIGLDIATIASTNQAERIIFVANDTDFVPALKFARRTGRKVGVVIIDLPGGSPISPDLKMNSDYCREVAWPKDLELFKGKTPTAMANAFQKSTEEPTTQST